MRGAFNAGVKPDARGHMDDIYKNDNHITYSTDSLRSKDKDAPPAGKWISKDDKHWTFYASPRNVENAGGADKLREYFKRAEPNDKLVLPR
jgi:hypothetical protein